MKDNFICILGIDGSGKSTLAIRLVNRLNQEKVRYRYIWGGCKHYITFPFIFVGKKILMKNTNQFDNYSGYHEQIQKKVSSSIVSRVYHYLILLDYYFQILFKIRIPLFFGRSIITDRYIYGTIIDMAVNLAYDEKKLKNSIANFLSYCPKPNFIFFIDVPEEIAFDRKNDIPSLDYLKFRRKRYLSIIDEFNFVKLDGLKKPDELEKTAMDMIFGV